MNKLKIGVFILVTTFFFCLIFVLYNNSMNNANVNHKVNVSRTKVNRRTKVNKNEEYKTIYSGAKLKNNFYRFTKLKKYLDCIQKDRKASIVQIIKSDIDNDGNKEFIVSFEVNNKYSDVYECEYNYIVRLVKNKYNLIYTLKPRFLKMIYVDVVKLDNSANKYIYLQESCGYGGIGSVIYKFNNEKISTVEAATPEIGNGVCGLYEDKNTGIFKAIDINRYYDIQHHEEWKYYIWDGTTFKPTKRQIKYTSGEGGNGRFIYPKSPEKLIECYLEALNIKCYSEIKLMQYDNNAGTIDVRKYFSPNEEFKLGLEMLKYEKITSSKLKINYKVKEDSINKYALVELIKQGGRWKIKNIKGVE